MMPLTRIIDMPVAQPQNSIPTPMKGQMNRPLIRAATASILAMIACFVLTLRIRADALPSTQPAIQTGELDLAFTERSPLSTQEEIARRLKANPDKDYDLSTLPFKAYVPTNYDPTVRHGLIVYLGYKDTVSSPPLWHPPLEKYHVIFISPVCHTGDHYAPSVPLSQTFGLTLDAVYNCKKKYNIDDHRVYLMSWNNDSAGFPWLPPTFSRVLSSPWNWDTSIVSMRRAAPITKRLTRLRPSI